MLYDLTNREHWLCRLTAFVFAGHYHDFVSFAMCYLLAFLGLEMTLLLYKNNTDGGNAH